MTEMNTDEDRYRSPADALEQVVSSDDFPEGNVDRLELNFQASGEVTWRCWESRAEEPIGGYLAPPSQS